MGVYGFAACMVIIVLVVIVVIMVFMLFIMVVVFGCFDLDAQVEVAFI
jgi:uncharacterized membrane protein